MNATVFLDRSAPRILVAGSITGLDLQEYVPVSLVRSGVTYVILYSMFATLLFVLLCAVLFKNGLSPQKRRLPVVWVLGLAMLAGLLGSTLNTVFWAYQLFGDASTQSTYRLWISSTSMLYVTPLITHLALQLRLMSFYPAALASRRKRLTIAAFPTLLKFARIILIGFTLQLSSDAYLGMRSGWADGGRRTDTINLCIFVLQFADTFYASCFLLWKFHCMGRRDKDLMRENAHWSLAWLKQIMYAVAFGYVLPTLYSLGLVVCKIVNIDPTDLGYVLVANIYVQAFGAVLAMLSRSHRWREDRFINNYQPESIGRIPSRSHRSDRDPTSFVSVDGYGYRGDTLASMQEAEGSVPVSFDSQSSLNAAELGQARSSKAKSRTSDFRLKRLMGGRSASEHAAAAANATAGSHSSGAVGRDGASPRAQPRAISPALPRLPTPTADSAGLQRLYTEFPTDLDFDQLQERRSSDATLISGSQAALKGSCGKAAAAAAATAAAASGQSPERLSSSTSLSSSSHGSRPGSRGTDRMQRLGSSRSIPLSVAEEDLNQDAAAPPPAPRGT
ncbi:uncharacterized protein PFL1_00448 [Pseudozyma flocculosa PF-1]|uniref:Uncharacterized protein n=1 Tax=Pseudozyma flocculosa TaxID=84751 RepID=A0A5C3ETF8_9BASI|nr:uncharacterized protein PFL1_00448 [Pseudozyma flocculosa PF-1]EPQ32251.1 hypothetical protein PFL1_00448 [Pseudozyma flocculosa PF-1]SPO34797.1 uncharacterized protein PSFLO_00268 [Pseudozyma flocculosa]